MRLRFFAGYAAFSFCRRLPRFREFRPPLCKNSAITWAYLAGTDLTGTAKAGLAASAIAMEGAETINPAMSAESLKLRAGL